mmetsp:Transcript_27029/g.76336  ORF Transcript_27029/g.76336 Transcript_27029/m.76336 type:complete len:164 (-) Transcript_27029:50-541(-)
MRTPASAALAVCLFAAAGAHDGEAMEMPDGTYVCTVCGYVYDPAVVGTAFADQPSTFACPVSGTLKAQFRAWVEADNHELMCINATHHRMGDGQVMLNSGMDPDPCAGCPMACLPGGHGGDDHDHGDHDGHDHTSRGQTGFAVAPTQRNLLALLLASAGAGWL